MHRVTRISFNSSGWRRPTGEARDAEAPGTYNREHGFGHEDWFFRSEWTIDGWRYAFLQGVNKSHAVLVEAGEPFDLTLYTVELDGRRRYVANVAAVECLDDDQAEQALRDFERLGWLAQMRQEIADVNGDVSALGAEGWAKYILNVRFRLENLVLFSPDRYADEDDPIRGLHRYMLYNAVNLRTKFRGRSGSTDLPPSVEFVRRGVGAVVCTPEHARMQAKLMSELQQEFPKAAIVRERDFVDVSVRTDSKLMLFEIKSDLSPRAVIREALGQILEYAFHPSRRHDCQLELVIVGRQALSGDDASYLRRLQDEFRLPVTYRVVEI